MITISTKPHVWQRNRTQDQQQSSTPDYSHPSPASLPTYITISTFLHSFRQADTTLPDHGPGDCYPVIAGEVETVSEAVEYYLYDCRNISQRSRKTNF